MDPSIAPLRNQRLAGVREHLVRIGLFKRMAASEPDRDNAHRLRLAAIYSCRALTELMLDAAEKQQVRDANNPTVPLSRSDLESLISPRLTYYELVERLRIHDFHRFGIVPPNSQVHTIFVGGPIKVSAKAGSGAVWVTPSGLNLAAGGDSQVRLQRPLVVENELFYDDVTANWVTLEQVVATYIAEASAVVSQFESLVA